MEDIIQGTRFDIISKSWPESKKTGERYDVKLTVKHTGVLPDKCIVKLYNTLTRELLNSKSFLFGAYGEKEFVFPLIMGTDDQYYRVIVLRDNFLIVDDVQDGFNAMVRYVATIPDPDDAFCKQDFYTQLDGVATRGRITVGGVDVYTDASGLGSITLIKGNDYTGVARIGTASLTKSFVACTANILIFGVSSIPDDPVTGKGIIGEITHVRTVQVANDEIKFSMPITNPTSLDQCYILHLYDQAGTLIYSDPEQGILPGFGQGHKIPAGATKTMIIDSNYSLWHLGAVNNQLVRFDLVSIPEGALGCSLFTNSYVLADSKTFQVPLYQDVPGPLEETMETLIILVIVIIVAMLVAKFS